MRNISKKSCNKERSLVTAVFAKGNPKLLSWNICISESALFLCISAQTESEIPYLNYTKCKVTANKCNFCSSATSKPVIPEHHHNALHTVNTRKVAFM